MPRRLITVTALTAGLTVAAISLATPALAKGPSQASITGPGLAHAIVVSGNGEPGEQGTLAVLAGQTGLFTALFGPDASVPDQASASLPTPPPKAFLGPRYTVTYTVAGVTPQPGEQYGRVRQDLYPDAVGGPVIYTPPGQDGFGMPLQVTGWLRASPQLTRTLARLGVPLRPGLPAAPQTRPRSAAHLAAAHQTGSPTLAWLMAAVAAAALAVASLRLRLRPRHRRPVTAPDREPTASGRAAGSA